MEALTKVFRADLSAGDALLSALTAGPDVASEGWNPLPTRGVLEKRSCMRSLKRLFNPPRTLAPFYVADNMWAYDGDSHRRPTWQNQINDVRANYEVSKHYS